jgi:hypothetical protein
LFAVCCVARWAGVGRQGFAFSHPSPQCDLVDNREVSNVEGRDLAKSFGVPFFESSAKSRINVEEAFYELVRCFTLARFCFFLRLSAL